MAEDMASWSMASWSMQRCGSALALSLICMSPALAADLRVPQDHPSIQAAIDAAGSGDVILVSPGTYNETLSIANKSLTIRGTGTPSQAKLDRFGAGGTVVNISGTAAQTVTFESMTITRWSEFSHLLTSDKVRVVFDDMRLLNGGGGVYLSNDADFTNIDSFWVLVGSFNWEQGSPINSWSDNSDITVQNSSFQGCRGRFGGAIRMQSGASCTVTNSSFTNCQATFNGGVVYQAGNGVLSFMNAEFTNCRSNNSEGGLVRSDGEALLKFEGCLGVGMSAVYEGSILSKASGPIEIRNSTFRDATAGGNYRGDVAGGFIQLQGSSLLIEDSIFENLFDSACCRYGGIIGTRTGGSLPITILRSRFTNCRSNGACCGTPGGAIFTLNRPVVVQDCVFENPSNDSNGFKGGALAIEGGTYAISRSRFDRIRTSSSGGAIWATNTTGAIADCDFLDCISTGGSGGAIYVINGSASISDSKMMRCTAVGGSSEAVSFFGSGPQVWAIDDCLFVGSSVRGYDSVPMRIQGSTFIQADDTNQPARILALNGAPPFIENCSFKNQTEASIQLDGGNYAVLSGCTFCRSETQEIQSYYVEKDPCTFEADCASDCDVDGIPDSFAISSGLATDCNDNGIPDSCDFASGGGADCNNNDILDICEIAAGTGADCNNNSLLDACEPDCDGDGIPNSCEIAAGAPDCDANGIPDSCQSDCDADGVIDACEITAGAPDCNTNGIPDSCEIANGSAADFNKDAIPDSCQPEMQFAGLELEIVPIVNRGLDDLFPQTAICYRLYARTTVAGAAVVGLFGNNAHPLTLSATGGFWQSPFGGDLASQIPCNLSDVLPSARYDSWFTVGLTCAAGNSVQNTGLDLTAFNNGGGVNDNDGIVFVQPGAAQSIAGTSKRVLLAQLTTNSAVLPSGFIDVVGRSASGTTGWEAYNQAIPVPALVDCNNNGQQDAFEIALGTVRDCDQSGVPDTCEYPSASTDCNGNGIPDLCDVVSAFSADLNGNFVPDECECSGDVDGNGRVDVDDIIDVIASWGALGDNPADVNNDDVVGAADLAIVLAGYGSCL
jgi:hypothetical protein